jgi:hypothetical protein
MEIRGTDWNGWAAVEGSIREWSGQDWMGSSGRERIGAEWNNMGRDRMGSQWQQWSGHQTP